MHIIRFACENQYRMINFGATGFKKTGAYTFKRKFASEEVIMWSAEYSRDAKKEEEFSKYEKSQMKEFKNFIENGG